MYKISNIKISLKIEEIGLNTVKKILKKKNIFFFEKNNYLILKDIYVYVFFKSKSVSKHVNVTKINNIEKIKSAISFLKETLNEINVKIISETIDNITATLNYQKEINLKNLANDLSLFKNIKFNQEKFPGLFLKTKYATLIIFHTGKINKIGFKDPNKLPKIIENTIKLIEK